MHNSIEVSYIHKSVDVRSCVYVFKHSLIFDNDSEGFIYCSVECFDSIRLMRVDPNSTLNRIIEIKHRNLIQKSNSLHVLYGMKSVTRYCQAFSARVALFSRVVQQFFSSNSDIL